MILAGVLTVTLLFVGCDAAKILAYYPIPSISHQIVYRAFSEELARRGHDVTVITPDPSPNPPDNMTQINVHDMSYKIWTENNVFVAHRENNGDPLSLFTTFRGIITNVYDYQMSSPEVSKILSLDRDHFDLIIGEAIIPFAYTLVNKFDAPLVGIGSMTTSIDGYEGVGAPTHPLLYYDMYSDTMVFDSIWKKLHAIILHFRVRKGFADYHKYIEDRLLEKYYGPEAKTMTELSSNVDLLILNCNPLFTGIRPVGPNTLLVNGLHLKKTKKELPKDLKNYLDNAVEGVVYFSLGTNALAKDFSPQIQQIFKDAFRRLPYKVIWKYELDEMSGKPENVKIIKWVPQFDLLGHKNVKAFIMQGGQQSIDEAIYNKVPVVGIPVLGDQDMNIKRVIHHGLGVGLNLNTLTSEILVDAVHEVIDNKNFKEKISKFSDILQDQPETPLQRAVWWTEYVIRHKGAKHLRSPAAGISNWEYFMMDVVLLVLGVLILVTIASIYILRKIMSLVKINVATKKKTS